MFWIGIAIGFISGICTLIGTACIFVRTDKEGVDND